DDAGATDSAEGCRGNVAGSEGDVLLSGTLIRHDTPCDGSARGVLEEEPAVVTVEYQEVAFVVTGHDDSARRRRNASQNGSVGVVLPANSPVVGIHRGDPSFG